MATVTKPLTEVAREVFAGLGYTIADEGETFRAVRDWKDVHVVPVHDGETVPADGEDLRCFVAWHDRCTELIQSLEAADPDDPWAVVGVYPDGDHDVVRPPADAA